MRYFEVTAYRKPSCDECNPPYTTFIAAKDDEDYEVQLKRALWRAEDYDIEELSFEKYNEILRQEQREKEQRELERYMWLHW